MIFAGLALLVAIALAFVISADAGSLIGLSQDQTARAIPLVVLLVILASSLAVRRQRLSTIVASFAAWIALGAILVTGYTYRMELSQVGSRVVSALQPGIARVDPSTGYVQVSRSFGGSFRIETEINGVPLPMIFDTGASAVVLSTEDAERVGLSTADLRFTVPVQTANGMGYAAPVTLDAITIGPIARKSIRAFVVADSALDTSLLGMTFLETLSRYSVSQDSLELED